MGWLIASTWYRTVGEGVLWAAAVIAALGAISKTPPAKWLWRQLVSDPAEKFQKRVVGVIVDEKIHPLAVQQEVFSDWVADAAKTQEDIRAALHNIHDCLDRRFTDTHARMERLSLYAEEVLAESVGSRERIRQLYRSLEFPVFETSVGGWCTYVNPAYSRLMGLLPEDALGEGWQDSLHPADKERVLNAWATAVNMDSEFSHRYRIINVHSGEEHSVRAIASPLHDGQGKVAGWVGTIEVGQND